MEYADNVDTVIQWHVENDVAAERQATDTRCELITLSTHQRLCGQQLKLRVEPVDPGIRLIKAVISDVVPNIRDVSCCLGASKDTRHLLARCL